MQKPAILQRVVLIGIWGPVAFVALCTAALFAVGEFYPPAADPLVVIGLILVAAIGVGAPIVSLSGLAAIILVARGQVVTPRLVLLSSIAGLLAGVPVVVNLVVHT